MQFVKRGPSCRAALAVVAALLVPVTCFGQTCTVSGTMNFGAYNPRTPTQTLTTGTITFRCTTSVPVKIKSYNINGFGSGGTHLISHNHQIQYELFLDPARTTPFGDGSNGTQYYEAPAPPANTNVTVPIFGEILAGQSEATAGVYTDTLTLEIDYE